MSESQYKSKLVKSLLNNDGARLEKVQTHSTLT